MANIRESNKELIKFRRTQQEMKEESKEVLQIETELSKLLTNEKKEEVKEIEIINAVFADTTKIMEDMTKRLQEITRNQFNQIGVLDEDFKLATDNSIEVSTYVFNLMQAEKKHFELILKLIEEILKKDIKIKQEFTEFLQEAMRKTADPFNQIFSSMNYANIKHPKKYFNEIKELETIRIKNNYIDDRLESWARKIKNHVEAIRLCMKDIDEGKSTEMLKKSIYYYIEESKKLMRYIIRGN